MFRIFAKRTDTKQSSPRRSVYSVAALVIFAFAMLAFTSAAHAQFRTSLQGTVTDPHRRPSFPAAKLTLKDNETPTLTIVQTSDRCRRLQLQRPARRSLHPHGRPAYPASTPAKVLSTSSSSPSSPTAVNVQLTVLAYTNTTVTCANAVYGSCSRHGHSCQHRRHHQRE